MTTDFANSNLSKIRPKLRTQGVVSGNFGKAKVKSGSSLKELGNTKVKVVKCTNQDDYLNRLYKAFDATDDSKLKQFIYTEIRKILVQRGQW
jgi:hypothetical protein